MNKCMSALAAFALAACGNVTGTDGSKPSEAWDDSNRPEIISVGTLTYDQLDHPAARRGSLDEKPWRDSYWPYHKQNIAQRYLAPQSFLDAADQIKLANQAPGDATLSPAEKYDLLTDDASFTLTRDSWSIYERLAGRYGVDPEEWSWMGICSGWAPASLAEAAPRGHVLARSPGGREVLLFAGDLRGLISKAYEINTTTGGRRTVGLRCDENADTLVTDEHGRIVDGRFDTTGEAFAIIADHSGTQGAIEIRHHGTGTTSWLVAPAPFRRFSGPAQLWAYASQDAVAADIREATRGRRAEQLARSSVTFFKGCRDINPASLHMTLVGSLAESQPRKQGFVVEMSRAHEVWNHPVWGYRASVGAPRSVLADPADVRIFRAPGTAFVADVDLRLVHAYGSSPQYDHANETTGPIDWDHFDRFPERYGVLRLRYTLEFDADGLVIGGEWGKYQRTDNAVPDFIWRTFGELTDRRRSDNGPSILRYSVLKRLLDCSQRPTDASREVLIGGALTHVSATTCQL